MGTAAERRSPEPGLHVRTDDAPAVLAATLAAELDGDLCDSAQTAESLLVELEALPPLTPEAIEVLTGLTARLAAAQRLVDRTLDRATSAVGERLASAGTGMAIHPSAVRERAAAVITARDAVAAADEDLRAAEVETKAASEPAPMAAPAPAGPRFMAPSPPPKRRFWDFLRRRRAPEVEDTTESTLLLQQMAASTDEVFGARRATAAREDRLALLGVERDRAEENLRVAQRAWTDLAGDDDVDDVEAVVRRFDPHHEDAVTVARDTVGVRAAMTLLESARSRWDEGWRKLELDPPADADEATMAAAARRLSRTIVLVGAAVDSAELLALAAPSAAVVAVEASS